MVRMSDILKKIKRKEEAPQEPPQQEIPPQPTPPPQAPVPKPPQQPPSAPQAPEPTKGAAERKSPYSEGREEKAHKVQEVRISPVIMKETKVASDNETEKLYDETLVMVEHIFSNIKIIKTEVTN